MNEPTIIEVELGPFHAQRYLGDGVYASHDGYQIWLAVNNHENRLIALDPGVMTNLIRYIKDHFGKEKKDGE